MFDVVMSLGFNCEVSFRIEDFWGSIDAMPFSWSLELDRDKFTKALENIDDLFTGAVKLDGEMIRCEKYDIKFHPRYSTLYKDGEITEESYNKCVEELKSRTSHLKEKYRELLKSSKSTLFLIKVEDYGLDNNIDYISKVYKALKNTYVSQNFVLVAVLEKKGRNKEYLKFEDSKLKIRYVKRFAPQKHTNTLGDPRGWYKIFRELTGEKSDRFYRSLSKRRKEWIIAAIRKRLIFK